MRHLATQIARHLPTTDTRSDGELLSGFLRGTDADFAEIVRRHGSMVWGVCRRALPDLADAEDACQAVFLVLVRRGHRLTTSPTIGPWLHRVAVWTARNIRRRNARQLARRSPLCDQLPAPAIDPALPLDLDSALLSLPEKYRSPIVLCHLLGFTRTEAAERLNCPEGTLSAWLSRGLAKLRVKLGGFDPAKAVGVGVAVPLGLSGAVVRAAVASRVAAVAVPVTVSRIVEGVLHMFWVKKATAATAALFAVFALGMGVGLSTHRVPVAEGQEKIAPRNTPAPQDPLRPNHAARIKELELQIKLAEEQLRQAEAVVAVLSEALAKPGPGDKPAILVNQLAANQKKANDLKDSLVELQREYQAAKQLDRNAIVPPPADLDAQLRDLERQLRELAVERERLAVLRDQTARQTQDLAEREKAIKVSLEALVAKREALTRGPAAGAGKGFVELTVHGKEGFFEYSIKETDAAGKLVGTVIVREPEMLQKVLARTKADATAPKELRVNCQPTATLTPRVLSALKACDAAGFGKVKFTGYVFQGGFATQLTAEQKGDVKGYNFYEGVERTPTSLITEIEEGARRF